MKRLLLLNSILFFAIGCAGKLGTQAGTKASLGSTPAGAARPAEEQILSECHRGGGAARSLDNVDLYGSTQIDLARLLTEEGGCFQALLAARSAGDLRRFAALRLALTHRLQSLGDFAYVDLAVVQGFSPLSGQYLTIDLVDASDRARRLPFVATPTGRFEDPEGLLALWQKYDAAGFRLVNEGNLPHAESCPAYHCVFGFEHPDLKPYASIFSDGVAKHHRLLVRILYEDANAMHRATAAFLLGHSPDVKQLLSDLMPAFRDPSLLVRNNALRVVAQIASRHPEVSIPLASIIQALDFPATTDRNKAAAILHGLAKRPERHAAIARDAGKILLAMLKLKQPSNHDFAYKIFKEISGQKFEERDYPAWEAWLERFSYLAKIPRGDE